MRTSLDLRALRHVTLHTNAILFLFQEGIARVKAGNYAYMMESSMLEYYMERDCQLQSIGGLLDSKVGILRTPKQTVEKLNASFRVTA